MHTASARWLPTTATDTLMLKQTIDAFLCTRTQSQKWHYGWTRLCVLFNIIVFPVNLQQTIHIFIIFSHPPRPFSVLLSFSACFRAQSSEQTQNRFSVELWLKTSAENWARKFKHRKHSVVIFASERMHLLAPKKNCNQKPIDSYGAAVIIAPDQSLEFHSHSLTVNPYA